jgi:hypothetical protein
LAQGRLLGGAAPAEDMEIRAVAALDALRELFDQARSQANEALATFGMAEGITLRDEDNVRRYCATGADGAQRFIAILPLLRSGSEEAIGAYIGTSSTRATMYLVPVTKKSRVVWQVAVSGRAFDAGVVHDLFLSVFSDDPAATSRLSPMSGGAYFQTPWD